ncbi:BRCA1-associated ATM activator 1-like [Gigantopelta aegis]|uniref:BRCA1-associated ATM activator 1-like n=1 Tax=Gigantopelta aegis TaxID=1735272 RepID=UPI001B88A7B4|nr:BRCA1-associated ATM activator 1-like [Gigantopelta aegis]
MKRIRVTSLESAIFYFLFVNRGKMSFISKLSEVLKLFLHLKNPISDDTSLQRLLDLIHDSFTEKPDDTGGVLVEFLQSMVDDVKSVESSIVTFALSVCGIVGRDTSFYTTHHSLIGQLYQSVKKQGLTADPSIGTAYFKSLTLVCQNVKWVTFEDFIQEIVQEAYITLKGKGSLFHQSAARQFLVTTITNKSTENHTMAEPNIFLEKLMQTLVDDLMKSLLECTTNKVTTLDTTPGSILELWVDVLKTCPESSLALMDDVQNVVELSLKICLDGPKHLQSTAENLLINLLNCCPPEDRDVIMSSAVVPLLEYESLQSDFLAKHRAATNMQKSLQLHGESLSKLKAVSLLPLQFLFDASHLNKYQLETVGEIVSQKSTFLKLLSQTLDVTALDPGNHELVIDLLACTDVDSNMKVLKCPQAIHLIGNTKLQIKLMSTIAQLADTDMLQQTCLSRAIDITLNIISQPQVDPKIYQVGQTCLLSKLSCISRHDSGNLTQCFPRLTVLLEKRLVDTRWEVRDTAIDGIKQIITRFKDNNTVLHQVSTSRIVESAWRCHVDTDSYVRASAFSLIGAIAKYPQIWNPFVTGTDCQEDSLVNIALDILNTDSEAFARRATVDFLHSIYYHHKSCLTDTTVRTLITGVCLAVADFDWEVKCKVLHFIKMVSDNIHRPSSYDRVPEYAAELRTDMRDERQADGSEKNTLLEQLMFLAELGCLDALCDGFHDFDQTVQQEAYTILHNIKTCISESGFSVLDDDDKMASKTSLVKENGVGSEKEESSSKEALSKFMRFLRGVDFEAKSRELLSSVDEYVRNPVSLLDDILSADFVSDSEENTVDCY